MKYDANGKRELYLTQIRSQRTISDVAERLHLEQLDADAAVTLSERLAEQLKAQTPEGRQATLVSSALALADIKELCETLNTRLEEVGGEIRRLKSHNAAVTAYRRSRAVVASGR